MRIVQTHSLVDFEIADEPEKVPVLVVPSIVCGLWFFPRAAEKQEQAFGSRTSCRCLRGKGTGDDAELKVRIIMKNNTSVRIRCSIEINSDVSNCKYKGCYIFNKIFHHFLIFNKSSGVSDVIHLIKSGFSELYLHITLDLVSVLNTNTDLLLHIKQLNQSANMKMLPSGLSADRNHLTHEVRDTNLHLWGDVSTRRAVWTSSFRLHMLA